MKNNAVLKIMAVLLATSLLIMACVSLVGCGDSANRTKFGDISFILPDKWTAEVNGDKLEIKVEDRSGTQSCAGVFTEGEAGPDVDASLDGIVTASLKGIQGDLIDASKDKIAGMPARVVKFQSEQSTGITVTYYLVVVAGDKGMTSLILSTSNTDVCKDYESIIDSIKKS